MDIYAHTKKTYNNLEVEYQWSLKLEFKPKWI